MAAKPQPFLMPALKKVMDETDWPELIRKKLNEDGGRLVPEVFFGHGEPATQPFGTILKNGPHGALRIMSLGIRETRGTFSAVVLSREEAWYVPGHVESFPITGWDPIAAGDE